MSATMEENTFGTEKPIALISVYNKKGIDKLATFLCQSGFRILTSGGTYRYLIDSLIKYYHDSLIRIEDFTGFPEILNGRVKTLHPKIYAGLLADKNNEDHNTEMAQMNLSSISMVIVNLYPFKQVISNEHSILDAIENIDIGGVSLIRAAAKNFKNCWVVTDPNMYSDVIKQFTTTNESILQRYATHAFKYILNYDSTISAYYDHMMNSNIVDNNELFDRKLSTNSLQLDNSTQIESITDYRTYTETNKLKYGCNPNQFIAGVYSINNKISPLSVKNGNPGYINMIDALQSWQLVHELGKIFPDKVAAASFKHTAPAGVALSTELNDDQKIIFDVVDQDLSPSALAFIRARNADPLSSYGDFIAINGHIDICVAKLIKREVSDGIIASSYDSEAMEILCKKKGGKFIVMKMNKNYENKELIEYREIFGLMVAQQPNKEYMTMDDLTVSESGDDLDDYVKRNLILAQTTLKYTPSNSIAYAANDTVIGIGAGQQNRIDCVRLAGEKAKIWYGRHKLITFNQFTKEGTKRQDRVNAVYKCLRGNIDQINSIMSPCIINEKQEALVSLLQRMDYNIDNDDFRLCMVSDAFFPFSDNIEVAHEYGVQYTMHPCGSIMDSVVLDKCNELGIQMIRSKYRTFLH